MRTTLLIYILTILIGQLSVGQSELFGIRYQTDKSYLFTDIVIQEDDLIAISGDYMEYFVNLISTDNYNLKTSIEVSPHVYEAIDLITIDDTSYLVGINMNDSTLNLISVSTINDEIYLNNITKVELPEYYIKNHHLTGSPYTFNMSSMEFKSKGYGVISSFDGRTMLYEIANDSIDLSVPIRDDSSNIFYGRHISVINNQIGISAYSSLDLLNEDLFITKSYINKQVFPNSGWVYDWDSVLINANQINYSLNTSIVLLSFLDYDLNLLHADSFGMKEDNNLNINSLHNPISFYNEGENIYVSGSLGGHFSHQNESNTRFYLASYNESLNKDWYIEFENNSNYGTMGVLTLSNNNALIYGYEARSNRQWKAYPFLIEVDQEGFIVNSTSPVVHNNHWFQIHPNPSENYIIINTDISSPTSRQIIVYDQHGHKLFTRELIGTETFIDISPLHPGVYYITLFTEDRQLATKKLIKY